MMDLTGILRVSENPIHRNIFFDEIQDQWEIYLLGKEITNICVKNNQSQPKANLKTK